MSEDAWPQPPPPTWSLTGSPGCDSRPHHRPHLRPHRLALGITTHRGQHDLGQMPPAPPSLGPRDPGRTLVLVARHTVSFRENKMERSQLRLGLPSAQLQSPPPHSPLCPYHHLNPVGKVASGGNPQEAAGISWEWKVRGHAWEGLWRHDGLRQEKQPPVQEREGAQSGVWKGKSG